VAREQGAIVGGCQLLLRRLSRVGLVAYVARGPLAAAGRPDVSEALLTTLLAFMRSSRLVFAKVQPPEGAEQTTAALAAGRWRESDLAVAPDATTRIDLSASDDELTSALHRSTRRGVRIAERAGVTVRRGERDDVATLARLVELTGRRQGIPFYGAQYFLGLLDAFAGGAHVLVAEHGGEPQAAGLVITFGDTATYAAGGWSGEHSQLHASKLLHWEAMRFARTVGCRYYDLFGIARETAARIAAGEKGGPMSGVDEFKLAFGGEVVLLPPTFDRSFHPLGPGIEALARRTRTRVRLAQLAAGLR
jgi:lipid II:glycine glycyltransferase (peptidoglycan interpeptide bridge formation enzyme)